MLKEKKLILATAESCTGGLISSAITDVPGSSDYFDRGVIVYSNDAKVEFLGVLKESLEEYGAVSKKVAQEMVMGIIKRSNANIAIATTGVAGPSGGTLEKPVGLVFIAMCVNSEIRVFENFFGGSRKEIKKKTALKTLELLLEYLQDLSS